MMQERLTQGIWPLLWIAILGFILYGQTIRYDYTYLDDHQIVLARMDQLQKFSSIPKAFTEDVFHNPGEKAFYYRPMLTVSFVSDGIIGGGKFAWFHVTNILLHILATWFLFLLLTELGYDRMKSFLFTLIFLVHPVLVHAVAWVPGRNDTLLALFLFPSMIYFIRYLKIPHPSSILHSSLFIHYLFFILALLTKETAIAIPFVAASYIIFIYKKYDRRLIWLFAGWTVISAVWLTVRYHVLGGSHGYPLQESVTSVFRNLGALFPFIGKSLVPAGLSVFPILKDMKTAFVIGIAGVFLFVFLPFTGKERRWGHFLFAVAWFLLFLIPSFIKSKSQEPDFTEHRVYVSLAGMIIFFLEAGIIKKTDWRKTAFLLPVIAVILVFGFLTLRHSSNYENRIAFWTNAVEKSPSHAFNYNNLGAMYFLGNNLPEAEKYFRKAIEINPLEPLAHGNLGLVYMNTDRPAEAEKFYLREIEINPGYDHAWFNLGLLYAQHNLPDQAVLMWEKLLTINPYYTEAYKDLIIVYTGMNRSADTDRIRALAAKNGVRLE